MKNKYLNRAHISERKFKLLLMCYALDETASKASQFTNISTNSAERIFILLRERVAILSLEEASLALGGEFEVDESYFGAKRVRGKRGRGAAGKTPVFGLLKRGGKVYTQIVKQCSRAQLMPIIQGKVLEDYTINSDGWKAYDGLVLNGYEHYRIHHSTNEFARGKNHVNGIESFWSYAKRRLSKFNGFTQTNFPVFLKETEYRFNHRQNDLYKIFLRELKKKPLRK